MKPKLDHFAVVTATTDHERASACIRSWVDRAAHQWKLYVIENGGERLYLGTVPAFAEGVRQALAAGHEVIACLHDDLLIEQDGWDQSILFPFRARPQVGLLGFLGGTGLGDHDIYQTPYSPHQLARQGVVSNERNAEAHGRRVGLPTRVAVLDGFCQVGRRAFWEGKFRDGRLQRTDVYPGDPFAWTPSGGTNLFAEMASWGLVHHAYDAALGCFAARLGWEVWCFPIACWHQGGATAVADSGYTDWARTQHPDGDQGFWNDAHQIVYDKFRDVLPVRV